MADEEDNALLLLSKDVVSAFLVVGLVFVFGFLYTGNWPPMVVIESGSMQHDDNLGYHGYQEPPYHHIGTIDTGDLVLVKEVDEEDIITYLEGKKIGYEKYGDYGDVIVYYKNNLREYEGVSTTPVIHRVMCWIDVLENGTYYVRETGEYFENDLVIEEIGANFSKYGNGDSHGRPDLKRSGYLTKGDSIYNPSVDQRGHSDRSGARVEPVTLEEIVGKAKGELPWFGLIKLRVTQGDNYAKAPEECKKMLIVGLFVIFVVPYIASKAWENYNVTNSERVKPKKKRE